MGGDTSLRVDVKILAAFLNGKPIYRRVLCQDDANLAILNASAFTGILKYKFENYNINQFLWNGSSLRLIQMLYIEISSFESEDKL